MYFYLVSTIIIEHRIPHDIKVHATQFLKSSKRSCYFKVKMAKPNKSLPSCCISKYVFVIWLFNSLKFIQFKTREPANVATTVNIISFMALSSCKNITYLQESTCSITNSFLMPFQKLFGFLQQIDKKCACINLLRYLLSNNHLWWWNPYLNPQNRLDYCYN